MKTIDGNGRVEQKTFELYMICQIY